MPSALRFALVLALVCGAAGCRQADGPIPTPTADQSNEIGDIARDMINVAGKDPQGPEDLRGDLSKYGSNDEAVRRINDLAKEISGALAGVRLTDETANKLANVLWLGLNGKELSERQVEALGREVKTVLASTGVTENRAQAIADRLGAVQKAVTENRRRWYQVF
jgi:hypothetical protein